MSYTIAPTAAEMRAARDTLIRKAEFDGDLAREADERGDYTSGRAYRQRRDKLQAAAKLMSDCLDGILPNT
jgi:hypothetical protein